MHVPEQVLASVSHDLRSQVNVVAIASELVLRTANLQDTAFGKPLMVIARTARSMKTSSTTYSTSLRSRPENSPCQRDRHRSHRWSKRRRLFIAQGIVEGHDGRIWIDSREHAGTTVSFTLPRRESPYQDRLQGVH